MKDERMRAVARRLCALVSGLFLCATAYSAWTGTGEVTGVYSHNGHHFITTTITENACGSAGKFYWPTSDDDARDMLAIALTALTANKPLQVAGDFANPTCLYGGALVGYMVIKK